MRNIAPSKARPTPNRRRSQKIFESLTMKSSRFRHTPLPAVLPAEWQPSTLLELQDLLQQLWRDHPLPQRLAAAGEVCNIITEYEIEDAAYIWDHARELFLSDDNEVVEAGYDIIVALAHSGSLRQYQRVQIFYALHSLGGAVHLQQRPRLLFSLTDGGRCIEGFDDPISTLLIELLHDSYTAVHLHHLRQVPNPHTPRNHPSNDGNGNLNATIELIINIIKFNARSFEDADVSLVIQAAVRVAQQASPLVEIGTLIDIIDAFIIYAHIPKEVLPLVVRQLSITLAEAKDGIAKKIDNTLEWLLCTHLKDLVLETLFCMLDEDAMADVNSDKRAFSAMRAIERILLDIQNRAPIKVDVEDLLVKLGTSTKTKAPGHPKLALTLIQILLKDHDTRRQIMAAWRCIDRSKEIDDSSDTETRAIVDDILRRLNAVSNSHYQDFVNLIRNVSILLPEEVYEVYVESFRVKATWFVNRDQTRINDYVELMKKLPEHSCPLAVRKRALDVMEEAYAKGLDVFNSPHVDQVKELAKLIIGSLHTETDPGLQKRLVEMAVEVATACSKREAEDLYQWIIQVLLILAKSKEAIVMTSAPPTHLLCGAFISLFLRNVNVNADRAIRLYRNIVDDLLMCDHLESRTRISLSRMLLSLRSDIENHIFFNFNLEDVNELHGLPEHPPNIVSPVLTSYSSENSVGDAEGEVEGEESYTYDNHLNIARWLSYVSEYVIRDPECPWDVYIFTLELLSSQLTNQGLFKEACDEIKELRTFLCKELRQGTTRRPPQGSPLKQGDVARHLYNTLTALIAYNEHFTRREQDDMVAAFITGMTAWDKTPIQCIHSLTVCCYELPKSLEKNAYTIIDKMAVIVTKPDAAIHVLEFLAGLSRLTDLARSLKEDEIKRIFGVCFSYIDYVRGKRADETRGRSTAPSSAPPPPSQHIPEYVFALAYFVITFWFLTLRPADKVRHLRWVDSRLLSKDQEGNTEDQALVTLDGVFRNTLRGNSQGIGLLGTQQASGAFSSAEGAAPPLTASETWISEYCIATIAYDASTPWVEVTERRPSGADVRRVALPTGTPAGNPQAAFDACFPHGMDDPFTTVRTPVVLPLNDRTRRGLEIFDRTSPVDFFFAGVLYVSDKQKTEQDVLSNFSGSPFYDYFVNDLGERLNLLNCRTSTGGMDTSESLLDGKTTRWQNAGVTALVYHIATMMPTDRTNDPQAIAKKRLIGNDFVSIIFNNSGGADWDFNTISSAFNFVQIVVTPEARATFVETRTVANARERSLFESAWFRVQVRTREDFPAVSSAAETKVVSGKVLALYVRNLALNACVFAKVWVNRGGGDYPSSWKSRLQQIRQLRARAEEA
ncbi:Tuberous sclerosis 2-like protein [Taxawa tesnikishii (nom. ined.)]|nr:Tuberous sclerosis 2-like protein [Dothideales sp. JES 119]